MTAPACPYTRATPGRHILQPLPITTAVTFVVNDRTVPSMAWLVCDLKTCRASVAIPLITPGKEL